MQGFRVSTLNPKPADLRPWAAQHDEQRFKGPSIDCLLQGVDSVGIGYQPQRDNRVVMVLYFLFFMIIGFFFIVNLFVGIILDKFSEEHKKGNNPLLTDEQAKWVMTQCRVMGMPLKKSVPLPKNEVRKSLYTLVESNTFDYFIMICIGLNTAFLAMEHYNQVMMMMVMMMAMMTLCLSIPCCVIWLCMEVLWQGQRHTGASGELTL